MTKTRTLSFLLTNAPDNSKVEAEAGCLVAVVA